MQLSTLLAGISTQSLRQEVHFSRLVLDSRLIKAQDIFIALPGTRCDGRAYVSAAIAQGAVAVLVDSSDSSEGILWQETVPVIPIVGLASQLAELAARFYDYPARQLRLLGVTGTNGKTSCTHFMAQVLSAYQQPCAIVGTLGCGFVGELGPAGLTTPDAISLQAMLRDFSQAGAKTVAMEVSSHSIHQGRVNALPFDIVVFTNLTQDHLDYHGDMTTYANVKRRLFFELPNKHWVINADDAYGRQWIATAPSQQSLITYGWETTGGDKRPDVFADAMHFTPAGIKAHVYTPWGDGELKVPLIGQFNLSNALAVLSTLGVYGLPFKEVLSGLTQLQAVPGRMQCVGGVGQPRIVIDYAHTPDALQKALQTLRACTSGRLICVFGCGGDRDHAKRPLMARVAEQYADQVIVTNDNPRHEHPESIAADIMRGFKQPDRVTLALDRSKAIEKSIQSAEPVDCILIAGKGAERYQQIGDDKLPFDDVIQACNVLETI